MEEIINLQLNPTINLFNFSKFDKHSLEREEFINSLELVIRSDSTDTTFKANELDLKLEPILTDQIKLENQDITYSLSLSLPYEWSGHIIEINLFYKRLSKPILLATYNKPLIIDENKLVQLQLILYPVKLMHAPDWMKENKIKENYLVDWVCEYERSFSTSDQVGQKFVPLYNVIAGYANKELYLVYIPKARDLPYVYFSVYEIFEKKYWLPKFILNTGSNSDESLNQRNGIFGKINSLRVNFYLTYEKGVYCIKTSLDKNLTSHCKNQFINKNYVPHTTTLAKVNDCACLIGGALGDHVSGVIAAGTSNMEEAKHVMHLVPWLWHGRNNPIVEYIDGKLYFIGGNILEHQSVIELKENFKEHINHTIPIKDNTHPTPKNMIYLKNVNSVAHRYCHLDHEIYIFPIELFRDESCQYFIFDTLSNEVYAENIDRTLYKQIEEKGMTKYNSLQVVPISDKSIYFVLTDSTSEQIKTLFLFADRNQTRANMTN